jgi:hypothetical protein
MKFTQNGHVKIRQFCESGYILRVAGSGERGHFEQFIRDALESRNHGDDAASPGRMEQNCCHLPDPRGIGQG